MKIIAITPNEIVTLNDFPVHNLHILKIYFKIFRDGYEKMMPPCPVIDKKLVVEGFDEKLKRGFKEFEKNHSKVKYFLLDGSHKTTAASLAHKKVKVMIFEKDQDIKEAKELIKTGELFSLMVGDNIKREVKELKNHFAKKKGFQTIEEKTQRMVKEKVIPDYMIKFYKKLI